MAGLVVLASLTSGCMPMYLKKDKPAEELRVPLPPPASPRAKATGSLWRDDVSANYLFADTRARFPGDLLTIVIAEDSSGLKEADTSTSTETEVSGSLEEFFGLPQALAANNKGTINPAALVKASAARSWDGEGTTSRKGRLTARMTATVTLVASNGNLWVEGDKIISVNKEDQHLSVKGWVRPEDVDAQNQVLSTRIAGARLDYYGVGTVGIKQGPGFGYWLLDVFWPF
ncbi:MAG: flagellar basal body L-ring protein FlgH [Candidatus Binatia bacterium]